MPLLQEDPTTKYHQRNHQCHLPFSRNALSQLLLDTGYRTGRPRRRRRSCLYFKKIQRQSTIKGITNAIYLFQGTRCLSFCWTRVIEPVGLEGDAEVAFTSRFNNKKTPKESPTPSTFFKEGIVSSNCWTQVPYYQRPGKGNKDYPIPASWKRIFFMTETKLCISKILSVETWLARLLATLSENLYTAMNIINEQLSKVLRMWRSC